MRALFEVLLVVSVRQRSLTVVPESNVLWQSRISFIRFLTGIHEAPSVSRYAIFCRFDHVGFEVLIFSDSAPVRSRYKSGPRPRIEQDQNLGPCRIKTVGSEKYSRFLIRSPKSEGKSNSNLPAWSWTKCSDLFSIKNTVETFEIKIAKIKFFIFKYRWDTELSFFYFRGTIGHQAGDLHVTWS